MTNFESIKSMTVDEMTAFLTIISEERCDYPCGDCETQCNPMRCSNAIKRWLKEPADDWMTRKQ